MSSPDILRDLGLLALGSRLKRLSERLLSDAAKIHLASAHDLPPGQFPLIAALDRYGSMSVNEAARALGISQPTATRAAAEATRCGLVQAEATPGDRRFRMLSLTEQGRASVADMKLEMWPRVEAAARQITSGISAELLSHLALLEDRLAERSLLDRYADCALRIVPFTEELAPEFLSINREWIEELFELEDHDREVLENPRRSILDPGGEILFVRELEGPVIGTCAIERHADGDCELSKMGVKSEARGRGAGEFLLRAVLERTRELGLQDRLFLLSNTRCAAAVHLYERAGFRHDTEIMERFGKRYARTDVAMRFAPSEAQSV